MDTTRFIRTGAKAHSAGVGTAATAALALAAALAGCVISPLPAYGPGYQGGEIVTVAPPPAQVEAYGPPPAAGYVWIGGYWNWVGGRHVWVGGHWAPPRAGWRWTPHRWEQVSGGWRERPGRWER